MRIGALARRLGLTADAIRFYERRALLPHPPRTAGGYRQFSERDAETLAFIRRVQRLGFTLGEIRALLLLREANGQPCAPVRRRLEGKLRNVRAKLADLQQLEEELTAALRSCSRRTRRRAAPCPLLRRTGSARRSIAQ